MIEAASLNQIPERRREISLTDHADANQIFAPNFGDRFNERAQSVSLEDRAVKHESDVSIHRRRRDRLEQTVISKVRNDIDRLGRITMPHQDAVSNTMIDCYRF